MFAAGDGECIGDTVRASVRRKTILDAGCIHAAQLDRTPRHLHSSSSPLHLRRPSAHGARPAQGGGGTGRILGLLDHSAAFQLRIYFPAAEILAVSDEERHLRLVGAGGAGGSRGGQLVVCERIRLRSSGRRRHFEHLVVGFHSQYDRLRHLRRMPCHVDRLLHPSFFGSLGLFQVICFFWHHDMVHSIFFTLYIKYLLNYYFNHQQRELESIYIFNLLF